MPDHDTLRMLASCYLVCQAYFLEISNASRTDASWNDDLRAWQRSFQRLLQAHRHPAAPVEQRTIAPLREALRAQQRQEALARCAALLKALSAYIATLQRTKPIYQPLTARPSAALGNVALLISYRRPSALAALGSRLPKLPEAISDTLRQLPPAAAHHPNSRRELAPRGPRATPGDSQTVAEACAATAAHNRRLTVHAGCGPTRGSAAWLS